jgi:SAM-dependent methyltransferase
MELDVLRGMDDKIQNFDYFVVECSARPIYKGEASAEEVIRFMEGRGYTAITPMSPHDDILFVKNWLVPHGGGLKTVKLTSEPPKGNKLNIGSGQRRFDNAHGWINVDSTSREPDQVPDLICDVGHELLPYADGSMDLVVLHQVYEHFGCGEAMGFAKEAWRVLKVGGSLIITVPDMRALAQRWLTGYIDDWIFFVNTYGAYQGEEGDRHKWGYSRESLKKELEGTAAWAKVVGFDWRVIQGADIARDWWILGMEAIK